MLGVVYCFTDAPCERMENGMSFGFQFSGTIGPCLVLVPCAAPTGLAIPTPAMTPGRWP